MHLVTCCVVSHTVYIGAVCLQSTVLPKCAECYRYSILKVKVEVKMLNNVYMTQFVPSTQVCVGVG